MEYVIQASNAYPTPRRKELEKVQKLALGVVKGLRRVLYEVVLKGFVYSSLPIGGSMIKYQCSRSPMAF